MRKKIFVLVVILLAIFPGIGAFTGLGSMSDTEMMHHDGRTRQKIEGISDTPLWFEEGLGGRRWFLRLHSAILYDFFNQSTNEDSVQVGKEDFLFLGDAYNTSFSLHSGAQKYAQQTLEQTKRGYETFMGILAQKGIPSLFIIAPDKDVVYGEYYPSWVKKVDLSFPKEKLNIQGKLAKTVFLDYCLLKYKEQHNSPLLYYKSDTHWNALGGFVAYNAVMDAVADLWGRAVKRVVLKSMKLDPQQDRGYMT